MGETERLTVEIISELQAKLDKIEQIMNKESEGYIENNPCLRKIREVLKNG